MSRDRVVVGLAFLPLLTVALGCSGEGLPGGDGPPPGAQDPTDAPPPVVRLDEGDIEVLWDGAEAENPSRIALIGDSLIAVADRRAVHLVAPGGGHQATLGVQGEGPGEFLDVKAVGGVETILVADGRLLRLTAFDLDGRVLGTWSIRPSQGLGTLVEGPVSMTTDSVVLLSWTSAVVSTERPDRQGLVAQRIGGDPVSVAEWTATEWVNTPSAYMPRNPASGPEPFAFAPHGARAYWTAGPRSGCVFWAEAMETDAQVDSTCPPVARVDLRSEVPSIARMEAEGVSGPMIEMLSTKHEYQVFEGSHDAFQRLFVGRGGCLWLRIVKDDAAYDSFFDYNMPSQRPPLYEWWVWDPGADQLVARVLLPNRFDPQIFWEGSLYGLAENPDLTKGVARASGLGELPQCSG